MVRKKLNSNLDIATLQSLKNRPELIEEYSQIIIDEVHHIPAVSFEIPLKRFKGKICFRFKCNTCIDKMGCIQLCLCNVEILHMKKKRD